MSERISDLLERLDRHIGRIPLAEIERLLGDLTISVEDVTRWMRFGEEHYRRNLMHEGPAYQALILCWRNGQRSPIHDHQGSSCGVRVIAGVALETVFERTGSGMVFATRSVEHPAGSVCATEDRDIHQVSNLMEDGADLVTLHVYSPPLLNMGTYTLFDSTVKSFFDPVHNEVFLDGGGI